MSQPPYLGPPPPPWGPPPGAPPWPPGPVPLDQPLYDASFADAVTRVWRKKLDFSGRASRSEYWWWVLAGVAMSVTLQGVGAGLYGHLQTYPQTFDPLSAQVVLPLIWSLVANVSTLAVAVAVRRLHDANRSGRWYLLAVSGYVTLGLELWALSTYHPERLATEGAAALDLVPWVATLASAVVSLPAAIILLVFLIAPPDPAGRRFDRG